MPKRQSKILSQLRTEAEAARLLFSNEGQSRQERTAVAGFLRVLGIDFAIDEIIKQGPEPIDVWFRDARFQVTEILDAGRARNLEVKKRADRMAQATHLRDLVEPGIISSDPISPPELVSLAATRAQQKSHKYGGSDIKIDLLIYVNMKGRHAYPLAPFTDLDETSFKGWRSVSIVMERFAVVLATSSDAPTFLKSRQGLAFEWQGWDSIFPIAITERRDLR